MRSLLGSLRPGSVRRSLAGSLLVGIAIAAMVVVGTVGTPARAGAATAPVVDQCNPPAYPTEAGQEVNCNVTINNTVTPAGATNSTVTVTACLAAAGVLPPFGCTTTVTTSNQLVTSVNQCNAIVYGGGSNITCNVSIINVIAAGTPLAGATVNQCIGSGTGGGTQPTVVCAPNGSTTSATVTQCNGSGNGGGGTTRVKCTVSGGGTALPVTINQCNGSSNGGGSTVTCATTIANNFVALSPPSTAPSSGSGGGTGGNSVTGNAVPSGAGGSTGKGITGKGGAGTGGSGTGGATGTGGSGTGTGVIPRGFPHTGVGGAAHSGALDLVALGSLALIGSGLAMAIAICRRRITSWVGSDGHERPR
jgi:hypothetical protein